MGTTTATSVAADTRSPAGRDATSLVRFDRVERAVHWTTAFAVLVLIATGALLYAGPLADLVGNRRVVREIHVYVGLFLPLPVLLALMLRAGRGLRDDLRRVARWSADDRRWWHRRTRPAARLGKFNPGQKINAVFVGAAFVVLLATGAIMRWYSPFSDDWRTGATFVHDWFALGLLASVAGHVLLALADPTALRGMLGGRVPAAWARRKYPAWHDEVLPTGPEGPQEPADADREERANRSGAPSNDR